MLAIDGTLVCYRLARRRRTRRGMLADLMHDMIQPLPPHEIWVIESEVIGGGFVSKDGRRIMQYRTKSGRLPAALDATMEGQRVTVLANVESYTNKLGAYISRVKISTTNQHERERT